LEGAGDLQAELFLGSQWNLQPQQLLGDRLAFNHRVEKGVNNSDLV
jgi:hypothetical protein